MPFEFVRAGRAILIRGTVTTVHSAHLWLILTDPDPETDQVVAVMVVTPNAHTDTTVCLPGDCHPWLKYDSHVDYGGAKLMKAGRIRQGLTDGRCDLQADLRPTLLAEVREGLQRSPRAIPYIQEYCARRCR